MRTGINIAWIMVLIIIVSIAILSKEYYFAIGFILAAIVMEIVDYIKRRNK